MTSEEIQSYSSHFLLLFDSCRAYRTIDLLSLVWSHKSIQFPFDILYTFSAHRINNHSWQIVRQMGNEVYSASGQRVLINICPWYICTYIYIIHDIRVLKSLCVWGGGESIATNLCLRWFSPKMFIIFSFMFYIVLINLQCLGMFILDSGLHTILYIIYILVQHEQLN